jgi:hypothetical protein
MYPVEGHRIIILYADAILLLLRDLGAYAWAHKNPSAKPGVVPRQARFYQMCTAAGTEKRKESRGGPFLAAASTMPEDCRSDLGTLLRLERETGIEPATSSLGSWHSTAELLPRYPDGWQNRPDQICLSYRVKTS